MAKKRSGTRDEDAAVGALDEKLGPGASLDDMSALEARSLEVGLPRFRGEVTVWVQAT